MPAMTCPICKDVHARSAGRPALATLAAFPRKLRVAVARVSRRRLARPPAPGEWSAVEVLGHLLDAEVTIGFRMRKLASEPGGAIVPWKQERWTPGALRHATADPRVTLDAFAALRAANVDQARRLAPEQRRAAGRHPEYGLLTTDDILAHFAEHDLIHLDQIRAALAAR